MNIYTRGGLKCVRAFPTALVMTDGVLSIGEGARKANAFILSILRARWFRTCMRVPAASAIADGTLRIPERGRKKIVFTFNICEYIYTCSGSERVRAFPTTSAMAEVTPGIPENAKKRVYLSRV